LLRVCRLRCPTAAYAARLIATAMPAAFGALKKGWQPFYVGKVADYHRPGALDPKSVRERYRTPRTNSAHLVAGPHCWPALGHGGGRLPTGRLQPRPATPRQCA
jgi:hypothetical protein